MNTVPKQSIAKKITDLTYKVITLEIRGIIHIAYKCGGGRGGGGKEEEDSSR